MMIIILSRNFTFFVGTNVRFYESLKVQELFKKCKKVLNLIFFYKKAPPPLSSFSMKYFFATYPFEKSNKYDHYCQR